MAEPFSAHPAQIPSPPGTRQQLRGVTSHHGLPCWPLPPSTACPSCCLFHGAQGLQAHRELAPPPHSLADEPGPPRGQQVLAVANSATKPLIMFHRKAWAQTRAFLQDGLQGPRATGAEGKGGHLRMPEPRGERVPPV